MHRYRTHTCGALGLTLVGESVRLSGWCHRIRDHGGLLFIDLRDHYGITQCVVDPDSPAFKQAEKLRSEFVIRVDGAVRNRPPGTENPEMPTGLIEVYVREIEVLGPAGDLPMPVFGDQPYPEDTRLKYRFLDLRREKLHKNIMLRGQVINSLRARMKAEGFFEFQTPILTASSPEGARDFLVPSRLHPGKFYALPQAPQQFKQLTMVAGFDRYFQIAPCFRDEDARADRSPGEFYQLDIEMSFVTQEDVFAAVEPVLRGVFEEFGGGKPVTKTFPMIPYAQAMLEYGVDKPDLRNPIKIADVTEVFRAGGRDLQRLQAGDQGGRGRARYPRARGLEAAALVLRQAQRLGEGGGRAGSRLHHFRARGRDDGGQGADRQILAAGRPRRRWSRRQSFRRATRCSSPATRRTRRRSSPARRASASAPTSNSRKADAFEFCWIVDFPMYEWNEEEKKIDFSHNPFSMPQGGLEALESEDPLTIKAFQYDIVCNGIELSSGAIRNHRPDIMVKAFEIAGYGEEVLLEKFGGMYRAFQCGAPPHGGIAPGVDRIVMLLAGEENLREVVLFPMNQRAEDLMMGAPSPVTARQLRELPIRLTLPERGGAGGGS